MTSRSDGSGLETSGSSEIARRSKYTDEEETFRNRCLSELSLSRPLESRIAAAYEICKEIPFHSIDTLMELWSVAKDLTTEDATIEARKAGFALLKASSCHSGILQERVTFFQMTITPIQAAEASLQISALDHLTKHGKDLWHIEIEVVAYLNSSLDILFSAAQNARKSLSLNKSNPNKSSVDPTKSTGKDNVTTEDSIRDLSQSVGHSKVGEERSLIGAFYLIEDIISHNPGAFSDIQLDILVERVISIARQTTSRKILHGVIKILSAIATHAHIPADRVGPCLEVFCTILRIPNIKFVEELSRCLANLLRPEQLKASKINLVTLFINTHPGLEPNGISSEDESFLHRLTSSIFRDPPKSDDLQGTVIQIHGQLFTELGTEVERDIFETCLRELCRRLILGQGVPSHALDCLADLASMCGPQLTDEAFNSLLGVLQARSGISSSDSALSGNLTDRTVECLIRLFLRCHPVSASKTNSVFNLLLQAAGPAKSTIIRLSVMKLLTRLRCDSEQAIEIVSDPDSQGLAGTLCRTEATASSLKAAQARSNRDSLQEHSPTARQGRSSVVDMSRAVRSRSATRSSNFKDQVSLQTPPLWMYSDRSRGLPEDPLQGPSKVVYSCMNQSYRSPAIDITPWLDIMIEVLKDGTDWEIYSYILVHLPSQLSNRTLFSRHVGHLQSLHNLILEHLDKSSFQKPPTYTGMKVGDVALCLYHALTMLLAYHDLLGRRELDSLVRAFSLGINKWDRPGKCCIHALALCCHEIPSVLDRHIFVIIQNLSKKITQSDLAIDILEFLAGLARLPDACSNATSKLPDTRASTTKEDATFFKTIFGICIGYVRSMREQRPKTNSDAQSHAAIQTPRHSIVSGDISSLHEVRQEVPEYVLALAYQVIIFWFLAIDVNQRAEHVGWIAKELASKDASGNEIVEEESQVILDMMHRTAYSDLGETEPAHVTGGETAHMIRQMWLLGMSVVTVEVSPNSNISQISKRQASGTTHATYHHRTAKLLEHHIPDQKTTQDAGLQDLYHVLPNHTLLQLTSTIAPIPIPLQPIKLPDHEIVQRALRNFDGIDTVDGHKAGVVYIGEGQSLEAEILANDHGSSAFEAFLSGLGTRVELQGALFNTQGLDRVSNRDGTHTYAWRDRVTEIVYHVSTMMPTDMGHDPQGTEKKRHIGNDRVKIVFNESSEPFRFDTFPSDFNEINIVISPEAHTPCRSIQSSERVPDHIRDAAGNQPSSTDLYGYYKVQTLSSSRFPQLSPAVSPMVVSAEALPGFVRQLALHASVFSQVWSEVLGQGEYISSWRARLRAIKKLREKYGNTHASANVSYPMPSDDDAPAYVEGDDWKGRLALGGMAEPDQLLRGLDFTRWS